MSLLHVLESVAKRAFLEVLPQFCDGEIPDFPVIITQVTNESFGHYQCNSPLAIGKKLGKNPREVALALSGAISKLDEHGNKMLKLVEIAGPGFINFTFEPEFLAQQLSVQLHDPRLGVVALHKKERVVVDFSSPNIAKELHVGHLRSTIIGESICRLFEFVGYDVIRLNHVGDWGTQFGMLIAYIKRYEPGVFDGRMNADLSQLMYWYRESKKLFDADSEFKKESQNQVIALQGGDPVAKAAWEKICAISRVAYGEIYDRLDVKIQERGESFYNSMLADVVHSLDEKGMLEISDGAKCVFLDGFKGREDEPLPMIIQKSDGGYNYSTTDLAAIRHRVNVEKASRIVYVVDAGQSIHLNMVFAAAKKAGFFDPSKCRVEHIAFGMVLDSHGKKFKTRSGETERLIDLIDEAVRRAEVVITEKSDHFSKEEIQEIAEAVGIGAIKYADLSSNRLKDYTFSYDRMLQFEGNTAAFLLYSFVRIHGIKRKAGPEKVAHALAHHHIHLQHPSEIALAVHLLRFTEVIEVIVEDLLLHRLGEYLHTLAEKFNAFFRDCHVIESEQENSRLLICFAAENVLAKGLYLLGLKTIHRM